MFCVRKPSAERIGAFRARQAKTPVNFEHLGTTRTECPSGFAVNHHRVCLGHGREAFERARQAIRDWKMFDLDWIQLCWPDTPIDEGSVVAILFRVFGVWQGGACRIVYTIDEAGDVDRFGFAYATIHGHPECGEERFLVEWNHADDSVWYDLMSYSRPATLLVRLGSWYARRAQKRFALGSLDAMTRATKSSS